MGNYLNKQTARAVLLRNFNTIDIASTKLNDMFLGSALSNEDMPMTAKSINYLKQLNYNVDLLTNRCVECGVSYSYSNFSTPKQCGPCNKKLDYQDEMITEPANWDELIHNLTVLANYFDTPDDPYHTNLIEAINITR